MGLKEAVAAAQEKEVQVFWGDSEGKALCPLRQPAIATSLSPPCSFGWTEGWECDELKQPPMGRRGPDEHSLAARALLQGLPSKTGPAKLQASFSPSVNCDCLILSISVPFPSQSLCKTCSSNRLAPANKIMNHKFYFKM